MNASPFPISRPTTAAELSTMMANAPLAMSVPESFKLRPADIVVATYPKCGTTWMQQIVHGLRSRGSMDFEEISQVIPFIEMEAMFGLDFERPQVAEPRAFKIHLSWELAPKGGRYIYVMREPGDALVSLYHFLNGAMFERDAINLEDFALEFFMKTSPFGRYWEHVRSWWEQRQNVDMLLFCYEDMKQDLEGTVRRVAAFMGLEGDEELIALATRQSSFEFMRAHEHQFDEHPMAQRLSALGGPPVERMTKVRSGKTGSASVLSEKVRAALAEAWERELAGPLGIRSYEELRARVRETTPRR